MNKIAISGRLTKDPELKELENGKKVSNITLAIDRYYNPKTKEKVVDFVNFTLWNKNAEKCFNIAKKGSLVEIDGYLSAKQVETTNGKINVVEPVVDEFRHICKAQNYENETNLEEEQTNEIEEETEMEK